MDNRNNVAYVNDKNMLRIFTLLGQKFVSMYQGETLLEYTDIIPSEVVQFTEDFNYLLFRASSYKIIVFQMSDKQIANTFTLTEKINDFSLAKSLEF